MSKILIEGGRKLFGQIDIAPAKNSCLPIIAAAIATNGRVVLANAPKIRDVCVMAEIIKDLGGGFEFGSKGLEIFTDNVCAFIGNPAIYGRVRASLFTAGALLSRFGRAYIPYPGGCNIGTRPIDIHIDGLKSLGVKADCLKDGVSFDGTHMRAGVVNLRYPSVGATVNIICAALCLKGETVIYGAACEPEIIDLCSFLNKCGYRVFVNKNRIIRIVGRSSLPSVDICYTPIFDRIEAGTFMLACLACGGEIELEYDCYKNIESVMRLLKKCGAKTYFFNGKIGMSVVRRPKPINANFSVYPALPTDLQPILTAAMCIADGKSVISDSVFPDRFCYVDMLEKFGAKICGRYKKITVEGAKMLQSASVVANDLRGGAALCVGAMIAQGCSTIDNAEIIFRGYERLCVKINGLGGVAKLV